MERHHIINNTISQLYEHLNFNLQLMDFYYPICCGLCDLGGRKNLQSQLADWVVKHLAFEKAIGPGSWPGVV